MNSVLSNGLGSYKFVYTLGSSLIVNRLGSSEHAGKVSVLHIACNHGWTTYHSWTPELSTLSVVGTPDAVPKLGVLNYDCIVRTEVQKAASIL